MGRRYYLQKRGNVYYAQLVNPETGKPLVARSTGKSDEDEARLVIAEWLTNGLPDPSGGARKKVQDLFRLEAIIEGIRQAPELSAEDAGLIVDALRERGLVDSAVIRGGAGSESLIDYFERFWDYEKSPYIREKRAHGQRIGRRHAKESIRRIRMHWNPYFEGKSLIDVRRADIKAFSLVLSDKGLSPASINLILVSGTTAIHWAYLNELIAADQTEGIRRFSGKAKARGVLTPEEAKNLFAVPWFDERARIGNLLAMTTGLRSGEILAIKPTDIEEDRLHVRHNWSDIDGLKTPKNGEERVVPLLPAVRTALLELVSRNPHKLGAEGFIFYSSLPKRPMDNKVLLYGLKEALIRMSIGDEKDAEKRKEAAASWKARNVVFHSWRHYYAARMADHIDARKVMQATGHKTSAVFEAYAAHATEEDFREVGAVAAKVFDFAEEASKIRGTTERKAI